MTSELVYESRPDSMQLCDFFEAGGINHGLDFALLVSNARAHLRGPMTAAVVGAEALAASELFQESLAGGLFQTDDLVYVIDLGGRAERGSGDQMASAKRMARTDNVGIEEVVWSDNADRSWLTKQTIDCLIYPGRLSAEKLAFAALSRCASLSIVEMGELRKRPFFDIALTATAPIGPVFAKKVGNDNCIPLYSDGTEACVKKWIAKADKCSSHKSAACSPVDCPVFEVGERWEKDHAEGD